MGFEGIHPILEEHSQKVCSELDGTLESAKEEVKSV